MSRPVDRPIISSGRGSAYHLRRSLARRGEVLAPSFSPGGLYRPPLIDAGEIILDACEEWHASGIVNADGVTVQINVETAGMQSKFWIERANPGGIGAVDNNPDLAIDFTRGGMVPFEQAARDGIRAHVAHLLNYALGEGAWSSFDPRTGAMRAEEARRKNLPVKYPGESWRMFGSCRTWSDLQGKWATSPTYSKSLNEVWLALEKIIDEDASVVDISQYIPPQIQDQWFPANGVSYKAAPMVAWGVCVHQTGNPSPGAEAQQNVNYMSSAACIARLASWHATVGKDVIIRTIPVTRQAQHASDGDGPGNSHFYAIEGVMCYPVGTPEFDRVLQNHAWMTAKVLRESNIPFSHTGDKNGTIGQHNYFARDGKNCPQFYRDNPAQWRRFLEFAQAFYSRNEWDTGEVHPWKDEKTGHFIHQNFHDFYLLGGRLPGREAGIPVWGRPIEGAFNEQQPDGKVLLVQYFERAVFQDFGNGLVETRLLGVDEFRRVWPTGRG